MIPKRVQVLIVGAGPSGMACAIALHRQGVKDIALVEASFAGSSESRATIIHAATLESFDSIGMADALVAAGVKCASHSFRDGSSAFVASDFSSLSALTRFPFCLICPQDITELVLHRELANLDVQVLRPHRVVGMKQNEAGGTTIDVLLESGDTIQAPYVIGADGARSTVRSLCGVGFSDPTSSTISNLAMTLADITFSSQPSCLDPHEFRVFPTSRGLVVFTPMPTRPGYEGEAVYRFICDIPPDHGTPPSQPSIEYLQALLDNFAPPQLTSDPAINPNPVHIAKRLWSTRFRTHSAVADKFYTHLGNPIAHKDNEAQGGVVFLVGDAAHIHSPAGGQGMNLGVRDSIGLAPVIAAHITALTSGTTGVNEPLQTYADARRARALAVVSLTKNLLKFQSFIRNHPLGGLAKAFLKVLNMLPFIRRKMGFNLSGLGAR